MHLTHALDLAPLFSIKTESHNPWTERAGVNS